LNGSDQKFWIGIASAFILPTLAYVYTQGMTAQSIEQLAKSVDKYQSTVDNVNTQVNTIANNTANNAEAITNINKHMDKMDTIVIDQNNRLVILETKLNRGR
jgi:peptidoglycan hydrolase CwlO-like protein